MRVVHVITDLGIGGAAIMLRQLALGLHTQGVENIVIALDHINPHHYGLRDQGIALHDLGMRTGLGSVGAFRRLRRLLEQIRPDVVHTWMYHADLVGGLAARIGNVAPVVWGVHHTPHPDEPLKRLTKLIMRVNARLSAHVPARIACCSHSSRPAHEALGYARAKLVTITNGFDTDAFVPDPSARGSVREELGLPHDVPLIGLMARFHPQKGHDVFIRAATLLMKQDSRVRFLLAGRGSNDRNAELGAWLAASGDRTRFHLLGIRHDMPRLMAACDIVTSASRFGEAFPLILGEAMSCGVPCVATNIGDSAVLIGDVGKVVAPNDPAAMAAAWASILELPPDERQSLRLRARERIVHNFQIARCVQDHMALYQEVGSAGLMSRT